MYNIDINRRLMIESGMKASMLRVGTKVIADVDQRGNIETVNATIEDRHVFYNNANSNHYTVGYNLKNGTAVLHYVHPDQVRVVNKGDEKC